MIRGEEQSQYILEQWNSFRSHQENDVNGGIENM